MKKWILGLTLVLGLIGLSACGNSDSKPIVKTKSGNVTKDELYEAMKDKYGEGTLQQLVFEKVLNKNYDVVQEKIDSDVEKLKEQYGEQFEFFLLQNQFSDEDELRDTLKFNQLITLAATKDVKITEDELKEYYDSLKTPRKVRHILVSPEDEKKAKEAKKKLDEGADFVKIAKEYSIDEVANENGGDIGFITSDQTDIDPDFRDAAFELELNKVSKPIQSSFGWHIIEVTEIEDKEKFEDIKSILELEMKEARMDNESVQAALKDVAKTADIKIEDEDLKDTFKLFLTDDDESAEDAEPEIEKEDDKKEDDKK